MSRIAASLVAGLTLLWWALGPWVPVTLAALLLIPRVRWWVLDRLPQRPWRAAGAAAAAVALLAGLVVVIPDGWLPIPPSPGVLAHPAYVGRPAATRPLRAEAPPAHPHLAVDTTTGPGPMGREPSVDTSWLGLEWCTALAWDGRQRLVARCQDPGGQALRVVDPDTMRPVATKELPGDGALTGREVCGGAALVVDDRDRALVTTADRRVLAVLTHDAEGEPDLTTDQAWDLSGVVPTDDCLASVTLDRAGRIWWASAAGRIGLLGAGDGPAAAHDIGAPLVGPVVADDRDGIVLTTGEAAYRFTIGPGRRVQTLWRAPRDGGSGVGPTLAGDALVVTDVGEARTDVVFLDPANGLELCRATPFGDGAVTIGVAPVSVGSGIVVAHGHDSPLDTALGRAGARGVVRIDLVDGQCREEWRRDDLAVTSTMAVSWPTGVVYARTKEPSWTGVSTWRLTALDAKTGERSFAVRTGTGWHAGGHDTPLTLAPDGAAWLATPSGLVRVRDRPSD